MKVIEILKNLWANKKVVKAVCNVAIKLIDSIDGELDWKPVNEEKK